MLMATKILTCPYCKGKGKAPSSRLSCMVCGAQGTITVAAGAKPCPACKGAGRQLGHILSCFTCRGKGVIEPEQKRAVRAAKQRTAPRLRKRRVMLKNVKADRVVHVQRKSPGTSKQRSVASRVPPSGAQGPTLQTPITPTTPVPQKEAIKVSKRESLWHTLKNLLK